MTIIVFDIRSTPEHQKPKIRKTGSPTFTDVAIKIGLLRVRILRLHNNLNSFDKALNDIHDCIMELEEVTKHD